MNTMQRFVNPAMGLLALAGVVLLSTLPATAFAQDEEEKPLEIGRWYPTLESGLNLSQSSYSDNWSGGDKGTVVWTFLASGEAKRQHNEKINWNNTMRLAYGQTHQQGADREWAKPFKSTDRIDLESILRFTLGYFVDPYASLRLETQFQDASDPAGRTLLFNPLLVKEAIGIAHAFYEEEDRAFLVRFGGAIRQGIRSQYENPAPDDVTFTETGTDGGLELVFDYKNKILDDDVSWVSKLSFFQPLFYSSKSDFEDLASADLTALGVDPDIADFTTTMDIDWENVFSSQVGKYITVSLYLRWLYDKYDTSVTPVLSDAGELTNAAAVIGGTRKAGQFKQTLALGVTYRFF